MKPLLPLLILFSFNTGHSFEFTKSRCFQIQKGNTLSKTDFIIETSEEKKNHIEKKILMINNSQTTKRTTKASHNFTTKKRGNLFIPQDFLFDFIFSKKIRENKTYQVLTDNGEAHFKIKTTEPPFFNIKLETKNNSMNILVKNFDQEYKIKEIFLQKSNLKLLPCELDTQLEILKNKEVKLFMGDQVAQAFYK